MPPNLIRHWSFRSLAAQGAQRTLILTMEWSPEGGCWLTPRELVWAMTEIVSDDPESAQVRQYIRQLLREVECSPIGAQDVPSTGHPPLPD